MVLLSYQLKCGMLCNLLVPNVCLFRTVSLSSHLPINLKGFEFDSTYLSILEHGGIVQLPCQSEQNSPTCLSKSKD